MADYTTLARPYANAVYQLAVASSSIDSWTEALAMMSAVASDEAMSKVLVNPSLGKEQKGEIFSSVLDGKLSEQQNNLVKLMAENGRLSIMPDVAEQFEAYRAQIEGKVEAEVTSAFPLSSEQESAITSTLKNKLGCDVSITTSTDESLLGGVVIKAGDTIIDASIKSQLSKLASTLSR